MRTGTTTWPPQRIVLGLQRGDQNLIDQSEALYNQCLDHDPNHVECHRGLAVLLVDTNRADRAFALMKSWASQNPTYSEAANRNRETL